MITLLLGRKNRTRLTPCFHPKTSKSVSDKDGTLSVAVAVPDNDSKDLDSQPVKQKPKGEIKRLSLKDLSGSELADLERNCSFFTDYAHLPKSSRGYHRQRDQDRHERAGHPGPEDVLAAALRKIAERRHEIESRSTQSELDFSALSDFTKASHNPSSVNQESLTKAEQFNGLIVHLTSERSPLEVTFNKRGN